MAAALKTISSLLSRTRSAGQELRDGVEDIRAKVAKLKAKKVEIESIPPTLDIALARVDDWVDRMSHAACERMVEPGFFARGPMEYVRPEIYGQSYIMDNFFGFFAPMFAETVKAQVATIYQGNPGISESERQRRLEDVDRDLLDAELAEESVIRAAEASGFPVLRRSNADPRAVLAADKVLP